LVELFVVINGDESIADPRVGLLRANSGGKGEATG